MIYKHVEKDKEDIYVDHDDYFDVFFKYTVCIDDNDEYWRYSFEMFKSSGESICLMGKDGVKRLHAFLTEMLNKD